jgi:hypothetical protein
VGVGPLKVAPPLLKGSGTLPYRVLVGQTALLQRHDRGAATKVSFKAGAVDPKLGLYAQLVEFMQASRIALPAALTGRMSKCRGVILLGRDDRDRVIRSIWNTRGRRGGRRRANEVVDRRTHVLLDERNFIRRG